MNEDLSPQEDFIIGASEQVWSDAIKSKDFSKVHKINYTWVLVESMLLYIDTGRMAPEDQKPANFGEWCKILEKEYYPMAWNEMINSMYHDSSSTEDLGLPLPHDHTLAQGIKLVPGRFMKEVLDDCHKHVKPADCDSSRAETEWDEDVDVKSSGLTAGGV